MTKFTLITDSASDLSAQMVDDLGIVCIPLIFTIEDKSYANYPDERELSTKTFYAMQRDGKIASTSAINTATFLQTLEPLLQEGKDVLYMAFSSALSSTYSASVAAVEILRERYPERKIYTVDTLCASMGEGLLVYLAAQQMKAGRTIEEVVSYVEETKRNLCHWFTVDDLNHLRRGGRLSATSAVVGTVLNIKPGLHVDDLGRLVNVSKVRGRRKAIMAIFNEMEATAIDPASQTVFISHGDCLEDAEFLAAMVKERLGVKEIIMNFIGPVIGAHSGSGTLALFFLGVQR